jgi:hypothetical protein
MKLGFIEDRLQAALKMDVLNGTAEERGIFEKQVKEAIAVIRDFRQELRNIVNADLKNFIDGEPSKSRYDEFYLWAKNRANFTLNKN